MPLTFGLMALAGLSLSGIPLTMGFISKTMLEEALVEDGVGWLVAIAVLSSIFTFAGTARLLWRTFFGEGVFRREENEHAQSGRGEAHPIMIVAMTIPVLLSILIGIFPVIPLNWFAWPAAISLLQPGRYVADILALESRPPNLVVHIVPPPHLSDWHVWVIPILVGVGGVLLTYYCLPRNEKAFWELPLIRQLYFVIRRWHSGFVTDYLLWNAFSTSVLLVLFVLIYTGVN
jgi:NADH:ubiquinone oxidoreductase subunit 5 (subunit L)/multisubunit Na+/H+ antiporter MnhA subunit